MQGKKKSSSRIWPRWRKTRDGVGLKALHWSLEAKTEIYSTTQCRLNFFIVKSSVYLSVGRDLV